MARDNWTRDEWILFMDLYTRSGTLTVSDAKVEEMSTLLRRLAACPSPPDPRIYPSLSAVAFKLSNLAQMDRIGPFGPLKGGRLEQELWAEYHAAPGRLAAEA